jgi:hypothetical protein
MEIEYPVLSTQVLTIIDSPSYLVGTTTNPKFIAISNIVRKQPLHFVEKLRLNVVCKDFTCVARSYPSLWRRSAHRRANQCLQQMNDAS